MLMDEPLDWPDSPSASCGATRRVAEAGVTAMVATHDLNQAADFDRVMLQPRPGLRHASVVFNTTSNLCAMPMVARPAWSTPRMGCWRSTTMRCGHD